MPDGTRPAPPDDTARVVLSGTLNGLPWAVVLWLQLTAATRSATDLAAILTTMSSAYNTNFVPRVTSWVVMNQIQAVWKTPGSGELIATNTTTRTGTNAGGNTKNIAGCAVLNWHIDQYYRGGKPRTYFPNTSDGDNTDGRTLTSTAQTNWQTAAEAFRVAVNAATSGGITQVRLGTVSFQRANAWLATPVFYPFNSVTVRPTIGIQRRRLIA